VSLARPPRPPRRAAAAARGSAGARAATRQVTSPPVTGPARFTPASRYGYAPGGFAAARSFTAEQQRSIDQAPGPSMTRSGPLQRARVASPGNCAENSGASCVAPNTPAAYGVPDRAAPDGGNNRNRAGRHGPRALRHQHAPQSVDGSRQRQRNPQDEQARPGHELGNVEKRAVASSVLGDSLQAPHPRRALRLGVRALPFGGQSSMIPRSRRA